MNDSLKVLYKKNCPSQAGSQQYFAKGAFEKITISHSQEMKKWSRMNTEKAEVLWIWKEQKW